MHSENKNARFRRPSRRLGVLLVLTCTSTFAPWALSQEDVVHRKNGIIMRGRIVTYDATGLKLLLDTGKELSIPAGEIDRVEVKRTEAQEAGEKLLERKEYRAAAERLEQAMKQETRGWLRSRIASQIVSAYVASGDSIAAIEAFFNAAREGEGKVAWESVPIWWLPDPPGARVTGRAAILLESANPWQQLIGASYLFGTEHAAAAREILVRLSTYRDERVGQLARTQLWRWEVNGVDAERVSGWQRMLEKLPGDLRAGPSLVLGLALDRLGRHDEAALAFLWTALVHPSDTRLASRATLLAADALERSGQAAEAGQLYRELIGRYGQSAEAADAQSRLNKLKE